MVQQRVRSPGSTWVWVQKKKRAPTVPVFVISAHKYVALTSHCLERVPGLFLRYLFGITLHDTPPHPLIRARCLPHRSVWAADAASQSRFRTLTPLTSLPRVISLAYRIYTSICTSTHPRPQDRTAASHDAGRRLQEAHRPRSVLRRVSHLL